MAPNIFSQGTPLISSLMSVLLVARPKVSVASVSWEMVDEGWGRRAVDFATSFELSACREYFALQHHMALGEGMRVLDVACGSGLAIELARLRGATCAGI